MYSLAGVRSPQDAMALSGADVDERDRVSQQITNTQMRLESLMGQSVEIMTSAADRASTPAIVGDINQEAILGGLGHEPTSPIDTQARFSEKGRLLGRAWESFRHLDLPVGPLDAPLHKMFFRKDSLQTYQRQELEGRRFGNWLTPYQSYVKPWALEAVNYFTGDPVQSIPLLHEDVQRKRMLDSYFDKLEYMKWRRLERQAQSQQQAESVDYFKARAAGTLTGFPAERSYKSIFEALPKTERKYFRAFSSFTDTRRRQQVLSMVPDDVKPVYLSAWSQQSHTSIEGNPLMEHYKQAMQPSYEQIDAGAMQALMSAGGLPDDNWLGWHPAVDVDKVRLKTGQALGMDIHDLGGYRSDMWNMRMYEPHIRSLNVTMPQMRRAQDSAFHSTLFDQGSGYVSNIRPYMGQPRVQAYSSQRRSMSMDRYAYDSYARGSI